MNDFAAPYIEAQDRILDVVLALPDEHHATPVPMCPGWTVWHLVAHLSAGMVDVTTGNCPELAGLNIHDYSLDPEVRTAVDNMAERQLRERDGLPLVEVTDEWRRATEAGTPMLRGQLPFPEPWPAMMEYTLVEDIAVHEDDLRHALELEPAPPSDARTIALLAYLFGLDQRIRRAGIPALALVIDGETHRAGEGETAATVTGSAFDLVMAMSGRRTAEEIRAFGWDGDPEPFLGAFSEYASRS